MTLEETFDLIGQNPENAMTDEQKAMVRYMTSRGFDFLSQFFLFDLEDAYWDIFEIEVKGTLVQ